MSASTPTVIAKVNVSGTDLLFDLAAGSDICIPISPYATADSSAETLSAFGIPAPTAEPLRVGGWVGSVKEGSSVNCPVLSVCFHGGGTHTECVGHITKDHVRLHKEVMLPSGPIPALLLSVSPSELTDVAGSYPPGTAGDPVITKEVLMKGIDQITENLASLTSTPNDVCASIVAAIMRDGAVVVRTLPNDISKLKAQYSGNNPAFFLPAATDYLRSCGIKHLVVDLPSVDRESDDGKLLAHRAFWGIPQNTIPTSADRWPQGTITELAYIQSSVGDGVYLLNLGTAPIAMDAAPARPILYPFTSFA